MIGTLIDILPNESFIGFHFQSYAIASYQTKDGCDGY